MLKAKVGTNPEDSERAERPHPPAMKMNPIVAIDIPPFKPPPLVQLGRPGPVLPLVSQLLPLRLRLRPLRAPMPVLAAAPQPPSWDASTAEVDMIRGRDGVWSARKEKRVAVLWDLDNKPPRGPPYEAAVALRRVGELFGHVVDISAYANRHAFSHLPQWVLAQRRELRRLDAQERKGLAVSGEPYVCSVCGRRCRTRPDLKKHFRQLHERERQKKISRLRSLKGKKRQRYRERFIAGNHKYEEAARELLTPKIGYGLASELRRAGVFVRTVEDKPQAADSVLKRQMQHSVARGMDWLLVVSDDSDFSEMVRRARESDVRTVVVGDGRTALGRHADLWVPWARVESGQVGEELLRSWQRRTKSGFPTIDDYDEDDDGDYGYKYDCEEEEEEEWEKVFYSPATFYEEDGDSGDLDEVVDRFVVDNSGFGGVGISAFSEEEAWSREIVGQDFGDDSFEGAITAR